jgi:hypothetical protein
MRQLLTIAWRLGRAGRYLGGDLAVPDDAAVLGHALALRDQADPDDFARVREPGQPLAATRH